MDPLSLATGRGGRIDSEGPGSEATPSYLLMKPHTLRTSHSRQQANKRDTATIFLSWPRALPQCCAR